MRPADGRIYKILLVEHDPSAQREVSHLLSEHGFQIVVAKDSRAAIERLADTEFHLVLTNLQGQAIDGLALAAAIRRCEEGTGERLPVLAMVAAESPTDSAALVAAGVDGCLRKPLDARTLLDKIEGLLFGA